MRYQTPGAGRLQAWDRAPSTVRLNYEGVGIAPHASVNRWSYTVPAARKAHIQGIQLLIVRVTAAAPVGRINAWMRTPDGAGASGTFYAILWKNAVGDEASFVLGSGVVILAGEQIQAATVDGSTGGTVDYELSAQIMLFDS